MLELALKQERTKFHKLKYGTEPSEFKSNNANSLTNANQGIYILKIF